VGVKRLMPFGTRNEMIYHVTNLEMSNLGNISIANFWRISL